MKRQQKKVGIIVRNAMPGCGFGKVHLFPSAQLALYSGVHISLDETDFRLKTAISR